VTRRGHVVGTGLIVAVLADLADLAQEVEAEGTAVEAVMAIAENTQTLDHAADLCHTTDISARMTDIDVVQRTKDQGQSLTAGGARGEVVGGGSRGHRPAVDHLRTKIE